MHPGLICPGAVPTVAAVIPFAAALAAAAVSALLMWLYLRSRDAAQTARLELLFAENTRFRDEVNSLRAERDRLLADHATLGARLAAEKDAHARNVTEFKALSADALRANRDEFLAQSSRLLSSLQDRSAGELDLRRQAVDALVQPIRAALERVDTRIAELEVARAGAYGALGEQLKALGDAQSRLQAEAAQLSTALRSTRFAGSWGELQLRRVVEMADMLPHCDFVEQETSGALRADLVVRLPGGQRIVVDAKAPLEAFRAAHDTADDAVRLARLADHAAHLRDHVDALGAKNYWQHFQPAPEFVVLFLPGDAMLSAALLADPQLLDRALGRRVLLATPTTLIALLKAAAYGWRQESVSRNAEAISALGRALHDRAAVFAAHLEKMGRGLDAAIGHYNSAVGSFSTGLLPGARKLAELGAQGAKPLPSPPTVDIAARPLDPPPSP